MNQGPQQLERLIAERLDGILTADEQARLDCALAADPAAAAMARQYERLRLVLSGWRTLQRDIDWESLAASIARRVAEDVGRKQDAAVDDLVRGSVPPMPEVDWDRFKTRVSSAVRREAASKAGDSAQVEKVDAGVRVSRRRWRRTATWMATVGAPLAAAAAIAVVIWWPGASSQLSSPHAVPVAPMVVVALDMPTATGRVAISFDQAPPGGYVEPSAPAADGGVDQPAGGGGMAIAVDSSGSEFSDSVDEAIFY
jgi:hypothetical protein